jgi:hypothetical protein
MTSLKSLRTEARLFRRRYRARDDVRMLSWAGSTQNQRFLAGDEKPAQKLGTSSSIADSRSAKTPVLAGRATEVTDAGLG